MEVFCFELTDDTTAPTVGIARRTWRAPFDLVIVAVRAQLVVPQVSGNVITVDVNRQGVSILATKLTIDNGRGSSKAAAIPCVIADGALPDDAEVTFDVDQIGDGTARGLKVTVYGYRPVVITASPAPPLPPVGGSEALIDRTLGTVFGDLTVFGISNAFDGVTNAPGVQCAAKSASGGYVGKVFPSGKIFKRAIVYGANDRGFCDVSNPSTTITIYGKNGSNPAGATDGTPLGTLTFTDGVNESAGREIASTDTTTTYTRIWAYINGGAYSTYCAELALYEWIP